MEASRSIAVPVVLICCYLCCLSVNGQTARLVINPPNSANGSVTRKEGEAVVFSCEALGIDTEEEPYLRWYNQRNQELTAANSGSALRVSKRDPHVFKLYLSKLKVTDSGIYTCTGTVMGTRMRASVNVKLYRPIVFQNPKYEQWFTINKIATVVCHVTGNPVPSIIWFYRGKELITGKKYELHPRQLNINNFQEEDQGIYRCQAEQKNGDYKFIDIKVYIQIPPKITVFPARHTATEDETEFAMSCQASGKPDPRFEFFKDEGQHPLASRAAGRVEVDGRAKGGVIYWRPPKREDRGRYRCRAYNNAGEDFAETQLTVQVVPYIPWPHGYQNHSYMAGSKGFLECEVIAIPEARITFRKVPSTLDVYDFGSNDNGRVIITKPAHNKLRMEISALRWADHSNYTCRATNTAGWVHQNATLSVNSPPSFNEEDPLNVKEMYLWTGSKRNISCRAQGFPYAHIEWYKDDYRLHDNFTYHIYRPQYEFGVSYLSVFVKDGSQGWIYKNEYECRARNKYGTKTRTVRLIEARKPLPPKSVTVLDQSPTFLELRIVPAPDPPGTSLIKYRIFWDSDKFNDYGVREKVIMEGLRPAYGYNFRIQALNMVGWSPVKTFSFKTAEVTAPYPPSINSDQRGKYPYEYTLHWEKPRTGGSPILEYEFRYRRVRQTASGPQGLDDWTKFRVKDDPARPYQFYTLQGLKSRSTYEVIVAARNDLGYSLNSPRFLFTTAQGTGPVFAGAGVPLPTSVITIVTVVFALVMAVL